MAPVTEGPYTCGPSTICTAEVSSLSAGPGLTAGPGLEPRHLAAQREACGSAILCAAASAGYRLCNGEAGISQKPPPVHMIAPCCCSMHHDGHHTLAAHSTGKEASSLTAAASHILFITIPIVLSNESPSLPWSRAAIAGSPCLVHVWPTDKCSCCWQVVSRPHLIDVWHANNGGEEVVGVAHSGVVCQDTCVCQEAIPPITDCGLPSALQQGLTLNVTGYHCVLGSLKVCSSCAVNKPHTAAIPGVQQVACKSPTYLVALDCEPGLAR